MYKNFSVFLFLAIISLSSCKKDDNSGPAAPVTIVDIQITDANGSDLSGVEVSLYKNQTDWANEENPVQTASTASNGVAKFMYLEDSAYYINAVSGNLSNWGNSFRISGIEDGRSHFATIKLGNHKSHMISSAQGKIWRVHAYKINGIDVTNDTANACITDNTWVFFKGKMTGRFERRENTSKCSVDAPALESGSWEITPNEEYLKLPQDGGVVTYKLISLTSEVMRLEGTAFGTTTEFTLVK